MRNARIFFLICALVALGLLFFLSISILFKVPGVDKDWIEDFKETPRAEPTQHGTVVLKHVRDWTYAEGTVVSKDWRDYEVDPKTITRVWFLSEPFSKWEALGHTFLSFEFESGEVLSFSIEARREEGEDYSVAEGLMNEYELAYTWGTERDFVANRVLYLGNPLHRYPLEITPEIAQKLFLSIAGETNTLAEYPRFYNTLTENCTNALAMIANKVKPNTLPYNIAWNLTGYADLYLMDQEFIARIEDSDEKTRAFYDIGAHKSEMETVATSSPQDFSRALNVMLGVE